MGRHERNESENRVRWPVLRWCVMLMLYVSAHNCLCGASLHMGVFIPRVVVLICVPCVRRVPTGPAPRARPWASAAPCPIPACPCPARADSVSRCQAEPFAAVVINRLWKKSCQAPTRRHARTPGFVLTQLSPPNLRASGWVLLGWRWQEPGWAELVPGPGVVAHSPPEETASVWEGRLWAVCPHQATLR